VPRIIDLNLINPPGVTVKLEGEQYRLPGDPPVPVWLGIIEAHDAYVTATGDDYAEALQLFHDRMLALFQIEQPDLDELPFGQARMFAVLAGFYGADVEAEEDPPGADEAASTTRRTNGRASSPAKPRVKTTTRSRSSRS
jgi:hypothetical protein